MDKFKQYLGYFALVLSFLFVIFGLLFFIKGVAEKSSTVKHIEYIIEQCKNNKYVIIQDTLILCPEVVINKPKEKEYL